MRKLSIPIAMRYFCNMYFYVRLLCKSFSRGKCLIVSTFMFNSQPWIGPLSFCFRGPVLPVCFDFPWRLAVINTGQFGSFHSVITWSLTAYAWSIRNGWRLLCVMHDSLTHLLANLFAGQGRSRACLLSAGLQGQIKLLVVEILRAVWLQQCAYCSLARK